MQVRAGVRDLAIRRVPIKAGVTNTQNTVALAGKNTQMILERSGERSWMKRLCEIWRRPDIPGRRQVTVTAFVRPKVKKNKMLVPQLKPSTEPAIADGCFTHEKRLKFKK